tara:strand:+ start:1272 stop:1523 length:252 start_codon:yes stop_codon:yes gene_type:complete
MIIYDEIKKKISNTINPENVTIIDNSSLHSKHKSFDIKKLHLKLIIESKKLKKMNKIEAHKEIFSILKNEMKNDIHALEIEIK